jgi:hypothetical protein
MIIVSSLTSLHELCSAADMILSSASVRERGDEELVLSSLGAHDHVITGHICLG